MAESYACRTRPSVSRVHAPRQVCELSSAGFQGAAPDDPLLAVIAGHAQASTLPMTDSHGHRTDAAAPCPPEYLGEDVGWMVVSVRTPATARPSAGHEPGSCEVDNGMVLAACGTWTEQCYNSILSLGGTGPSEPAAIE